MHFIQKHILDELRTKGKMRYAALQPDGIESSHFRYHLKELERSGYVVSPERGVYALTAKGQHYVDRLSRGTVNAINMPKVITYTLPTYGSHYVLHRKEKEPYKDLINMIGGKVHEGETTAAAAAREVQEKAGITIEAPTLAGVFEVLIHSGSDLLTHAIAYVYTAELPDIPEGLLAVSKEDMEHTPNLAPDTFAIVSSLSPGQKVTGTIAITL